MRCRRDGAALRKVGRLAVPAAERQIVPCDEIQQLRHGVRAVARVQQRIRERVCACAITCPAQQCDQRVVLRERPEDRDQIGDLLLGRADTKPPAVVLQHVDARPAIGRIHHQRHHAIRLQDRAKRTKSRIRVGEMVEHAGADNQIEAAPERRGALDGELRGLEIRQPSTWRFSRPVCSRLVVLTSMPTTRAPGRQTAYLAACHVPHPATRMSRSARYGFRDHSRWYSARCAVRVAPLVARAIEVFDRRRVGMAGIELGDGIVHHG